MIFGRKSSASDWDIWIFFRWTNTHLWMQQPPNMHGLTRPGTVADFLQLPPDRYRWQKFQTTRQAWEEMANLNVGEWQRTCTNLSRDDGLSLIQNLISLWEYICESECAANGQWCCQLSSVITQPREWQADIGYLAQRQAMGVTVHRVRKIGWSCIQRMAASAAEMIRWALRQLHLWTQVKPVTQGYRHRTASTFFQKHRKKADVAR